MAIDILHNRAAAKWTFREKVGRVLWATLRPCFRFSPRPIWGWRCGLLRLFGATIGRHVHIHPSVVVAIPWNLSVGDLTAIGDGAKVYNLGFIRIGQRSTISQGAHLCAGTHDYRHKDFPLVKSPITVGDDVWICADAFLGPGVTIADMAIVAARAVVMRDVPRAAIVAGNPAVTVKTRPLPQ
jgi:putative colanic acid biosynthesis acetyltransferase WcaF